MVKLKTDISYSSSFLGNYFCEIENYNLAFVAISKNAVTYLRSLAIYAKTGYIIKEEDTIHEWTGNNPSNGYLYPIADYKQNRGKNIIKFAVWRDPVERLVSCYKYFCLERWYRHYFYYLDLYKDPSFDHFMQFVRFELGKSDPLSQDEHIRKQTDFYSSSDIDFIVPIHKLNTFLENYNIPLIDTAKNSTHIKFQLKDEEYLNEIRHLYRDDYELPRLANFI